MQWSLTNAASVNYASSQADVVRSHVIAHSGEKSQKCNKCEYLDSHANTLKVHMKIHPGENDVKCNICPSMLHEEYTVKRKSFEVKSHKCNQCKYISHKSSMSIHSKEKPFEWTNWKCGTPQANNFREHVVKQQRKIISMQPLWICHCEYATSEATNLSTLKTQNGEQNVKWQSIYMIFLCCLTTCSLKLLLKECHISNWFIHGSFIVVYGHSPC